MRSILSLTCIAAFFLAAGGCRPSLPEAELPILGWYSITAPYLNEDNFLTMKEDGFNISFSILPSLEDARKALDLGEKTGMKILFTCPELASDPEGTVAAVTASRSPAVIRTGFISCFRKLSS